MAKNTFLLAIAVGGLFACSAPTTRFPGYDLEMPSADLAAADLWVAVPVDQAAPPDLAAPRDLMLVCGPGGCKDPTPSCDPMTGKCVVCTPADDRCPIDSYCTKANGGHECAPGCKGDKDCPATDGGGKPACCNHVCVDVGFDAAHCGKCGFACPNQACCGGLCTPTASDKKNCGGCGKVCPMVNNAMVACDQSTCKVSGCVAPFADCNNDPADGCEANLTNDPAHCLGCGKFCDIINGVAECVNGCKFKSCYAGFGDCNKNLVDGCEVATTKDAANCGACGKVCVAPPNAMAGCFGGMCAVGGCQNGFGDCNNNFNDGCETPLVADVNHCGKCGNSCNGQNANGACMNGGCVIASCKGAFADCNKNPIDGCEVDTSMDPAHCKACGTKCPAPANALGSCVNGVCGIGACKPDFGDCNNNVADGCEVDTKTTSAHCGGCGLACAQGKQCVDGKCSAGCLVGGKMPPLSCDVGKDPEFLTDWVVCTADCNTAWIAQGLKAGGKFHALQICQGLGYSQFGNWDGTCGNICGYCEGVTSCMMRGNMKLTRLPGAPNQGMDQFGPIIGITVHWQCLR